MTQFQLTAHKEAWYVTILHPNPIVGPVYLSHNSEGRLAWSNDWEDAKPFHKRRSAVEYALSHTKLKVYREPYGKRGSFIEVDFDKQIIKIYTEHGLAQTLEFKTYKALLSLPLHANALEPERYDDQHITYAQARDNNS
jgi:hypothetical protein